jgi:hypothetical protein
LSAPQNIFAAGGEFGVGTAESNSAMVSTAKAEIRGIVDKAKKRKPM